MTRGTEAMLEKASVIKDMLDEASLGIIPDWKLKLINSRLDEVREIIEASNVDRRQVDRRSK